MSEKMATEAQVSFIARLAKGKKIAGGQDAAALVSEIPWTEVSMQDASVWITWLQHRYSLASMGVVEDQVIRPTIAKIYPKSPDLSEAPESVQAWFSAQGPSWLNQQGVA